MLSENTEKILDVVAGKFNRTVIADNADEAFIEWYKSLSEMNLSDNSRDGDIVGECINAITVIKDPTRNIMKNKIRNLPMRYAIGEMLWYLSGNNSLKEIQKYSSGWDRMSDDGVTVNSSAKQPAYKLIISSPYSSMKRGTHP